MDAYSVTYNNSIEKRELSRIYQDLFAFQARFPVSPPISDKSSLTSTMSSPRSSQFSSRHIGIIGAGISGLRCADILLSHGFQVTILEGRNRIGGRVCQETLKNGHDVDMGANWVHGTLDNPIFEIAKMTGTACSGWDATQLVCDENGELLSTADRTELADMMWSIILDAFAHSNLNSATISPKESLYDWFKQEIPKRIPESTDGWQRKRLVVLQMAEMWGAFIGSPVYSQSLKFFWLEECIEGENLFCEGTYRDILAVIAQNALERAEVKYEAIVEKIKYRALETDDQQVLVQTRNGETFLFDDVVVTTPLGWLKQHKEAFEPELPARLSVAIDSIGYGCLEKVYIVFETAFWQTTTTSADNDIQFQGFCQWLSPKYSPSTNPHYWAQEMVELASLSSPKDSHNTLLFYTYGDQSRNLTSTLRALSSSKEKHAYLISFFGPYIARLPNYDATNPACAVVDCLASDWLGDELAGYGSYGNFQVGLTEGDKDIEAMRHGVPERGLWFAGEHTAPFVALGTTTGAYWSGEAVGKRIVE
ncbi:Protein FLOWERING LOCUS D, partial [Ceratocystis fimbriata CBS 114723]